MEARYLTLICEAERYDAKGMYEVAEIYYRAAAAIDPTHQE
jgi:hypothetical protein